MAALLLALLLLGLRVYRATRAAAQARAQVEKRLAQARRPPSRSSYPAPSPSPSAYPQPSPSPQPHISPIFRQALQQKEAVLSPWLEEMVRDQPLQP